MLCSATPARRRGIAAVEFAVIFPVLLLLLLGAWEVGRMIEVQQLLLNAAREGGRQASTGVKSTSDVQDVVVRYLNQNGIKNVTTADVTVVNKTSGSRSDPSAANQEDQFEITVTLPFSRVRWALLNQITSLQTLSAKVEWYSMRDLPITVDYAIPLQ